MNEIKIADWETLEPTTPTYALVGNVDLVVIKWEDIQFVTAQLHRVPGLDDAPVGTELVIGSGKRWLASTGYSRDFGAACARRRNPSVSGHDFSALGEVQWCTDAWDDNS